MDMKELQAVAARARLALRSRGVAQAADAGADGNGGNGGKTDAEKSEAEEFNTAN